MENKTLLKFNLSYDETTGIIYKKYTGSISLSTIIHSWEIGMENEQIPQEKTAFVLDYLDATFDLQEEEIDIMLKFFERHPSFFKGSKVAIVSDSPKDIVIPYMVKSLKKDCDLKPFTTVEAARMWILTGY